MVIKPTALQEGLYEFDKFQGQVVFFVTFGQGVHRVSQKSRRVAQGWVGNTEL